MESESWQFSEGESFCSSGCLRAEKAQSTFLAFILAAVSFPILLMMASPMYMSTVVYGSLAMMLVFSPLLILAIQGVLYAESVPRGSRAKAVSLDTAMLATVSTSVACPRCDANLDLRKIGKDRIFVCGYCGATGTVRIVDRSEQKRSGSGGSI
jgi:hypothetical protein